jgi:hypothetical protein
MARLLREVELLTTEEKGDYSKLRARAKSCVRNL